jgi:hypothetical protein
MITEFQTLFHCCISWRMLYVTIQEQETFLSLKRSDRNIFKYNNSLSLSRYTLYKCGKVSEVAV